MNMNVFTIRGNSCECMGNDFNPLQQFRLTTVILYSFLSETDVENILSELEKKYKNDELTRIDGLKIDFEDGWVHLRKSNTEPIMRIYSESEDQEKANAIAQKMINEIKELI